MSKRSRRFKPTEEKTGASTTEASSGRGSPGGKSGPSFFERYRNVLIGGVVVLAVGVVGLVVVQSGTSASYSCDELLSAPPAPAAGTDEPLGFIVDDIGRQHTSGTIRYATCPPTSGDHYAGGALQRGFYGPGSAELPGNWVHNLEHGYAVIAYSGDPGAAVIDQIRTVMDEATPSDVAEECGLPNKVLAVRFDDMSEPFAVLAWDRALLMSSFDTELAATAVDQFQDQPQAPERAC